MEKSYALLRLFGLPFEADRPFSYLIPDNFREARVGDIAAVPFGAANRVTYGVITGFSPVTDAKRVKKALFLLDSLYSIGESGVRLSDYLSEHLLCPFGDAAAALLPPGLKISSREILERGERYESYLDKCGEEQKKLLSSLVDGTLSPSAVSARERASLLRAKAVSHRYEPIFRENAVSEKRCRLVDKNAVGNIRKTVNSALYPAVCDYLEICGSQGAAASFIVNSFGVGSGALSTLEKHGVIEFFEAGKYRTPYESSYFSNIEIKEESLSAAQKSAVERLMSLYLEPEARAALLYGVTGSGKTLVFLPLIKKALSEGKSVIYLVPEIALTGQAAKLLHIYFGSTLAVIHSALSEGERQDVWRAVKRGEKRLILGTRSAIFSPTEKLGLIIIDEEQDASYKSDTKFRYHARNVARLRAFEDKALLLLASATPCIESFYKAQSGAYTLVRLDERYQGRALPAVTVANVSDDLAAFPDSLIGAALREKMKETLEAGHQVILFMNRRGYRKFMSCLSCGKPVLCPNCSVSLTLHEASGSRLVCHYCGYSAEPPKTCPQCGKEHMIYHGYGTQKLGEELEKKFHEYPALRMDADTTDEKLSHERIISQFSSGEAKILFGTQMVAKGHNFPSVALVGVIMADTSLYLADYRANENTFCLLTQVIGRAGRADTAGSAVIQTLSPYHEIIEEAQTQDYDRFYEGEIALRRALSYPPFCELALVMMLGTDENRLRKRTAEASEYFDSLLNKDFCDVRLIKFGPFDASVYKIKNIYRRKLVIKYKDNARTREFLRAFLTGFSKIAGKDASLTIDINPNLI